ncbi:FxSxx-COOH cyclophane-containing RiPP peptide [Actinoplanes sp. NPDC024001]|uniref:FxSxx-COOH cyclophane-containing RiPP peptide n=1 Tax=Actinoplanes sp. NPDC024001 TaxID=3154598 RepID=UPI0033F64C4F
MDTASLPDQGADPLSIPLIDVSELPLAAINAAASDVLARSLRQVIASIDDPNGVISAFQSVVADG